MKIKFVGSWKHIQISFNLKIKSILFAEESKKGRNRYKEQK